ncbi:restriction endonuclease subunit S [Nesterenkonia jeotgali]|uniref:Type I restriction enzyme S subunit n=1 Tax=Nesterenkonia jeotgali TaxID=317018 RepID=A0A839FMY7_9MICC|nr:restriction endonuclease subunit S [Nesterenkonia jeotgali]MBA8921266.1 type I restriction enzyme S subunit [Nesterenkonia jeotgali]
MSVPYTPTDWELVSLGDHFEITSSKRVFQRDWRPTGVPFYRARELAILGDRGRVDNELFIDRGMFDRYRKMYGAPSPGDFLVTGVGTLGKTYVVQAGDEFYFKDGNIIWLKASASVDSAFLKQLYRTPFVLDQVFGNSAGSTVGTYTITNANTTVIPLPSKSEQVAIARALADADSLISALESRIVKKQAIKQGVMQQLLGGETRLPGFSGGWREESIGQLCSMRSGAPKRRIESGRYWVVDMGSVTRNSELVVSRRSDDGSDLLRAGELVMPKDDIGGGNIIGRTALIERDHTYVLADHVYALTPRNIDPAFLNLAINSYEVNTSLRSKVTGSAQLGLSRRGVLDQNVVYPRDVVEQRAIAGIVADVNREIDTLRRRLVKTRGIKSGMMQELLTGRTRLPVEEVST